MKSKLWYGLVGMMILSASLLFGHEVDSEDIVELDNGAKQIVVEGITLRWLKNVSNQTITFTLSAPTAGWVAIGFDPGFIMKGADLKIGYVNKSGTYVEDHFANGWASHKSDEKLGGTKDISDVSGLETGTTTTITFTIPLNSGDEYDYDLSTGEEVEVMLAYGENDTITKKHQKHAEVEISF